MVLTVHKTDQTNRHRDGAEADGHWTSRGSRASAADARAMTNRENEFLHRSSQRGRAEAAQARHVIVALLAHRVDPPLEAASDIIQDPK